MIPIRNIYYMLAYAFQVLQEGEFCKLSAESFRHTADLFAAILTRGIARQLKQGLSRDYLEEQQPLSTLRGKLDLSQSIQSRTILKRQMVCTYDTFSVDTTANRILKATMLLLLRSDVEKSRKQELRRLMIYFDEVEPADLHRVNWNLNDRRLSRTYRMLLSVCYLTAKGLLQTQKDGSVRMADMLDEQRMCRLYEKFLLEYYRQEHPELSVSAARIPWQLDDGQGELLPVMQSDLMLSKGERVLILDAKYYAHTLQSRFDTHTIHSANLYQIFTYVKNKEAQLQNRAHIVSGMLLYAKTDEETVPDQTYRMSGNRIRVGTLDLNADFADIRHQLDEIARDFFPSEGER